MNGVSIKDKGGEVCEKRKALRGKSGVENGWVWNAQEERCVGEKVGRSEERRKEGAMREPQAKHCRT